MALETHRRAVRAGLPWLVAGLGLLGLWVAWPALLEPLGSALPEWIGKALSGCGAAGSACMQLALLLLARARVDGRTSPQLVAAVGLWLAELALRLWSASADEPPAPAFALGQVLASSGAMVFLSGGMAALMRRQRAAREAGPWELARAAFALFLLGLGAFAAWARWNGGEPAAALADLPGGVSAAWLAFLVPWALLVRAVRGSLRVAARAQSVSEILTS